MSQNLFDLPENCKTLNMCGRNGFPDRCATCGHTAPMTRAPESFIEDHKARVEKLFERMNRVINNTGGSTSEE